MNKDELTLNDVNNILEKHKKFFETQVTKNINFRIKTLKNLKICIKKYEKEIYKALYDDLGKHEFESYTTEVGFVYSSIENAVKKIKKWSKPKKVKTPVFLMPAESTIINEPYGTVLIIGPYNYPFQLVIEPLIGAISAGNTVVIKPSEISVNVSRVITKIISEVFKPEYICCVEGGIETNTSLINSAFDYIFFTGSADVGKIVMEGAAKNLVPVTLELGGKSPVIVDESANIKIAAQRIIWGKTVNTGQTCVAPDYIMVHNNVKDELIKEMKITLCNFYGDDIKSSEYYGRIINDRHFNRIKNIIEEDKGNIVYGGNYDEENRFIEPTLIEVVDFDCASMSQEIFGPILPIIGYDDLNKAIKEIKKLSKPLALYIFTNSESVKNKLLNEISSGGVCINDTITHLANSDLPFGGIGNAGMGAYHGEESFKTFSHRRSILSKGTKINLTMLFPPYTNKNLNLVKKFLK